MSVTAVPIRPIKKGSVVKLWAGLGALSLIAAGVAWAGTHNDGITTASGLEYRVVKEGTGPTPTIEDGVLIEYEGHLADGTLFDKTSPGQPAPLLVGGSIPGFTEGLQLMKAGGSYHLHIPADLAYGARGTPGGPIPPNAPLDFDVKLLRIIPGAAIQMQQQMLQQQGAPSSAAPPSGL
jgi:FKBP-type peptidyl-prolyl cis-trans isomerase FkpA